MRSLPMLVVGLLCVACSGDLSPDGSRDGGSDAGPGDSGPGDSGPGDSGPGDSGPGDTGPGDTGLDTPPADAAPPDAEPAFEAPNSIFFVGNSFTFGGPVPVLVEDLATYAGFAPPNVEYRAVGGRTLEWHRADDAADGAPARVAEGWDVVVLQEFSTRPTDQVGPAEQYKVDATWFYDLAKTANAETDMLLFETWARHAEHSIYPGTFSDPAEMQAELRSHIDDAAERYIPEHATSARNEDARVARAGDAWELHLLEPDARRLHGGDDYHANAAGAYLNALVIYSTIYGRRSEGLVPLRGLVEADALALQRSADSVSGAVGFGPVFGAPLGVVGGAVLRFDLGPLWVDGWTPLGETRGTVGPVATVAGAASSTLLTVWGFDGTQEGGQATNELGLPGDVSRDTLWVGSFDGHDAALEREARVVLRGLPLGRYSVELFASRNGDDVGRGRLTRYRVGEQFRDLEVSDNTSASAFFGDVSPDERGEVVIRVGVSPMGLARFGYLGVVRVMRTE